MKILIVEDDDAIAEALASIPILVCTASARAEEDARKIGAARWLRKPVDPARLLEAVGAHRLRPRPERVRQTPPP